MIVGARTECHQLLLQPIMTAEIVVDVVVVVVDVVVVVGVDVVVAQAATVLF